MVQQVLFMVSGACGVTFSHVSRHGAGSETLVAKPGY